MRIFFNVPSKGVIRNTFCFISSLNSMMFHQKKLRKLLGIYTKMPQKCFLQNHWNKNQSWEPNWNRTQNLDSFSENLNQTEILENLKQTEKASYLRRQNRTENPVLEKVGTGTQTRTKFLEPKSKPEPKFSNEPNPSFGSQL